MRKILEKQFEKMPSIILGQRLLLKIMGLLQIALIIVID